MILQGDVHKYAFHNMICSCYDYIWKMSSMSFNHLTIFIPSPFQENYIDEHTHLTVRIKTQQKKDVLTKIDIRINLVSILINHIGGVTCSLHDIVDWKIAILI